MGDKTKNNSSSRRKWAIEKLPQETLISLAQILNQSVADLETNKWETL